jgi:hypothetical protein
VDLIHNRNAGQDLTPDLEADRKRILATLKPRQRTQFRALDPAVRNAFMQGALNPDLIRLGITKPRYFLRTLELDAPWTKRLIENMAWEFGRIKAVAERHGARVLVVSVPYGSYVSHRSFETRRRLGFTMRDDMLVSTAPDDAIRAAARTAGVDFAEVTQTFRDAAVQSVLYYEFDGHFTVRGHALFASALLSLIEESIQ